MYISEKEVIKEHDIHVCILCLCTLYMYKYIRQRSVFVTYNWFVEYLKLQSIWSPHFIIIIWKQSAFYPLRICKRGGFGGGSLILFFCGGSGFLISPWVQIYSKKKIIIYEAFSLVGYDGDFTNWNSVYEERSTTLYSIWKRAVPHALFPFVTRTPIT